MQLIKEENAVCSRCGGIGYIERYKHIEAGICFKCEGTGRCDEYYCEDEEEYKYDPPLNSVDVEGLSIRDAYTHKIIVKLKTKAWVVKTYAFLKAHFDHGTEVSQLMDLIDLGPKVAGRAINKAWECLGKPVYTFGPDWPHTIK